MSLALGTAVAVTVVVPPEPVAADQVSDLKAQAAQIAQDLVLEQLQIGAYQQHYDVDIARVQRDQAEIQSREIQIKDDVRRVRTDRKRLQTEAVSAYMNMYPELDGSSAAMFQGNPNATLAKGVYEEVVSGDITLTMDVLRNDENELHAERAMLERQETQDQATTNQEAVLAKAARQTGVELESKQSEITGRLAVAVAQQQAAQAAAAEAAVRAAQAAAAAARPTSQPASVTASSATQPMPSTTTSTAAPGGAPGTSSADPVLPRFLQCVLQVESGGNYGAVSPGGTYMGGFQFSQPTWNEAAQLAGMPQLINVPPNTATPAEQDDLAIALYEADGEQPWNDSCRGG